MAFACRNCKERFDLTKLLTDSNSESEGYTSSVVSTQCGHLFHSKCLEGVLTNQKLLHARHGTGPLRRFCPVAGCNADIRSEDSLIRISFNESDSVNSLDSENDQKDTEGKLVKRVQMLMSEKESLKKDFIRIDNEAELLRSALDEIKYDLSDIQSFLKDDRLMKRGDLIFWVTKVGTYAPGKILELRKKPGENTHYAIIKLDKKTKVSGIGPHAAERDTLILPVTELITFKSFFNDFFDKFQAKFDSLVFDLNCEIQEMASPTAPHSSDRSTTYYRSTRKLSRSISRTSIAVSSLNTLDELDSMKVESIPVPVSRKNSQQTPGIRDNKVTKITRSKTIHYGEGNEPRRLEKCRSMSWATTPTKSLLSPTSPLGSSPNSSSYQDLRSPTPEEDEEADTGFIKDGERVIWFDTYSEYKQVGTVAAVCEYSPCAIVKFDEHPTVKHKFQYRTVPLDELFPYDLASPEDKFKIAETYGKVAEFVESHEHFFDMPNDEDMSLSDDDENDNDNE
ncbi:Tocopherol cyclase, chloroplastic [Orchesella cincta]|uniref:Tocopherol cyclase, chloroplastic n=1 Tax=Orchesella cincta TaxID=48709 RepID=A0A1D2MV33_ORCCI|nr:Tocopherol cyclase, chloroplastic [Orchesella cincta]